MYHNITSSHYNQRLSPFVTYSCSTTGRSTFQIALSLQTHRTEVNEVDNIFKSYLLYSWNWKIIFKIISQLTINRYDFLIINTVNRWTGNERNRRNWNICKIVYVEKTVLVHVELIQTTLNRLKIVFIVFENIHPSIHSSCVKLNLCHQ